METDFNCTFAINERDYQNIKLADHTQYWLNKGAELLCVLVIGQRNWEAELLVSDGS